LKHTKCNKDRCYATTEEIKKHEEQEVGGARFYDATGTVFDYVQLGSTQNIIGYNHHHMVDTVFALWDNLGGWRSL
jgi:hypothetical protein